MRENSLEIENPPSVDEEQNSWWNIYNKEIFSEIVEL